MRGGDGTSGSNDKSESFVVDLWPYFSPSCCSGPLDCETGFYAVYDSLFFELAESEDTQRDEKETESAETALPRFQRSDSPAHDVFAFYNYWCNFASRMSFSWEDKYNPADVPNRQVRRAIEKENKKFRDVARKKYNDTVRALASYVRKRDPRVMGFEMEAKARKLVEEQRRAEGKIDIEVKRREKRELSRIALESNTGEVLRRQQEREGAFLLANYSSDEDLENNDLVDGDVEDLIANSEYLLSKGMDQKVETEETSDSPDSCDICNKTFKTEAQLLQHLASKIHRKKVQENSRKTKKTTAVAAVDTKGKYNKTKPVIVCPPSYSDSESDSKDKGVSVSDSTPSGGDDNVHASTNGTEAKQSSDAREQTIPSGAVRDGYSSGESVGARDDGGDTGSCSEEEEMVTGKGKGGKGRNANKKKNIVDFATSSLRAMSIVVPDVAVQSAVDEKPSDKTKNKYKKKEKSGYFPKGVSRDILPTVFAEDCLDPTLRQDGVDVAVMPGPQKKKIKKISLRGF